MHRLAFGLLLVVAPLSCTSNGNGAEDAGIKDAGTEDLPFGEGVGGDLGRDTSDIGGAVRDSTSPDNGAGDVASPQHGDCRDEDLHCLQPFTCRENVTNIYACHSAVGDMPDCSGYTPQDVPLLGGIGYAIAHWIAGSCLDVTFEAALAPQSNEMSKAVAVWNAIACNGLCLKTPVEDNTKIPNWMAARRIHVTMGNTNEARPIYEYTTGRMLKAGITVSIAGTPTTAEWIRLFGGVMGLDKPDVGVDSIMLPQGDTPTITLPTPKDEAAICTLYGTPPLCGE